MKFGPIAVETAQGAILAHSMTLPDRKLRKGLILDAADIEMLKAAGYDTVVAAQLGATDIHENDAARALGTALLIGTRGIRASTAATGRVNLVAEGPGVVQIDAQKVTDLNSVNPMISLATVPPFHQTHKDGLIGTVKIISYGVPQSDLDAACICAGGALGLAPPTGASAELIVTQIDPALREAKGIAATQERVTALGSELANTRIIPHTASALAEALQNSKADIVLILTGSATSDENDVGPSALRQAGGQLTRFGMPVDPGNLLFLGKLNGKDVLGLPGCARSSSLNGADMVLSRLLCGVPVSNAEIAAMGVGGLLKEIPTRPRPRRG